MRSAGSLDAYAAGDVPSISAPSAAALTQALDAVAPQWTQAAGPAEKLTRQRLVALWLLDATAGQQSPDRDGLKLIHWARVFLAEKRQGGRVRATLASSVGGSNGAATRL